MLNNIKTIFLDYDGTLHESIKIYAPAFRKAYKFLVSSGYAKEKEFTDDEISYWLGFSSKDMWKKFMPDLDDFIKSEASRIIGKEMLNQITLGNASLYESSIETLQYLKNKGYKLVFISNCGFYYMESHRKYFKLDKYFIEMVCSEQYNFIPKHEILSKIKNKFENDMVIVGDRSQDIESGKKNNIITIGCSYGYGENSELKQADYIINNILDLTKLL